MAHHESLFLNVLFLWNGLVNKSTYKQWDAQLFLFQIISCSIVPVWSNGSLNQSSSNNAGHWIVPLPTLEYVIVPLLSDNPSNYSGEYN